MIFKRCHASIPRNFQLENGTYSFFAYFCYFIWDSYLCIIFPIAMLQDYIHILLDLQWDISNGKRNTDPIVLNLLYFLTGIWSRDIRYKSNLPLTEINKILKNLESKKLIKAVKSVAVSNSLFSSLERSLYVYCSKDILGVCHSFGYVMI